MEHPYYIMAIASQKENAAHPSTFKYKYRYKVTSQGGFNNSPASEESCIFFCFFP